MARMLADRDSSAVHINQARRHERLARRYRQEAFATAIRAALDLLRTKADITAEKESERQATTDEIAAADADLDDAIRTLYNSTEIHERENPGSGVLSLLFPEGGFSAITDISLAQEPAAAEGLANRVASLGTSHPLAAHAAKLQLLATAVRTAFAAQTEAIRDLRLAQAEEEIQQATLRRQYEVNYLDARKQLGRSLAERLFPSTRVTGESTPEPTSVPAPA